MEPIFKLVAVAVLAACLAPAANGGNAAAARKQLESSLRVSGSVTVGPDGTVQAHSIDPKAPLDANVRRFVDETVRRWRFAPVEVAGKVVTAQVPMHLRLVATPLEKGKASIRISSSYFGSDTDAPSTERVRSRRMTPPSYPDDMLQMGGQGTVYLLLQVGRDGRVVNVGAEQVNLRVIGSEHEMKLVRHAFARAAMRAAKRWTFAMPTTGEYAGEDAWLVRVPVDFVLEGKGAAPREDRWDTYVPGPRNFDMPWAGTELRTSGSPDAVPADGVYPLGGGVQLLTPPAT